MIACHFLQVQWHWPYSEQDGVSPDQIRASLAAQGIPEMTVKQSAEEKDDGESDCVDITIFTLLQLFFVDVFYVEYTSG